MPSHPPENGGVDSRRDADEDLLIEFRVQFAHCLEDGCRRLELGVGRELSKQLVAQVPQVSAQKQVQYFPTSLDRPVGAADSRAVCVFCALGSRPDVEFVLDAFLPVCVASLAEQSSVR